jgi:hypothetical protein
MKTAPLKPNDFSFLTAFHNSNLSARWLLACLLGLHGFNEEKKKIIIIKKFSVLLNFVVT